MNTEQKLSRRDRNLAEIREKATELAERIVLEKGGDALHARGLAQELKISVGSLYNAFGDLNGVVRAVNTRCAERLSENLRAAVAAAPDDNRARVIAIGEAYFDFAIAEPRRWWMLFERDSDLQLDLKTQKLQEGLLEMLVTAGGGDPENTRHRQFFLLLWASVHGLVSLACRPNIAMIGPDVARSYIHDLVDAGFRNFPKD
ncbi:TetR/AcrR family transcriptional regulator [uncultured Roseobacter sp.]|uniref:TetR/AcrR family transcriptional regulator n=1 Tax=uncultured Roseobacter sp. TaxID=114847 RepID=UPI002628BD38|nr:TetR/AcrR family transcriptional regulator [uncultured Roseobacter sp.]